MTNERIAQNFKNTINHSISYSFNHNTTTMLKKQYQKNKPVCKVTFTLPVDAIEAKDVRVLGEFNDWNWENGLKMKTTKGQFTATAELATGRQYQFRYMAANGTWTNDHAADTYLPTPFGVENSVVFVEEVSDVPAAKKKTAKKAAEKKTAKPAAAKKTVAKKTTAKKDDLKKIEGIGPKINTLLNEAGIVTFKDLATAKVTKLEGVLKAAGPRFKMHKPATWSEQAQLAADGKWDVLKKLQDELKGGKRK